VMPKPQRDISETENGSKQKIEGLPGPQWTTKVPNGQTRSPMDKVRKGQPHNCGQGQTFAFSQS